MKLFLIDSLKQKQNQKHTKRKKGPYSLCTPTPPPSGDSKPGRDALATVHPANGRWWKPYFPS